jgi:diguanylate cyclase (GGDEF)-like protein
MSIDLKTLILLNSVLAIVSAIMLTINWAMNRKVKGTKEWSITLWCWAFSMLLILFRGVWPPIITVVLSNGLVVIGSFYMLLGISRYHHSKAIPRLIEFFITALMFFGFYYYSLIDVNVHNRVLLLTTFSALIKFTALYLLIPTIRNFTAVGIMLAIGFIVHGLFFTYHSFIGAFGPSELANFQLQQTTIQLLIEVFLFMIWFTVSATMLTNVILQKGLKRLAFHDTLTGLLNRRSVIDKSEDFLSNGIGSNFSLLVLDLDNFKIVNDTYGHAIGDKVIQNFAKIVSAELRDLDVFGRIGGEEFLISLPNTNIDQAELIAKRICKAVRNGSINCDGKKVDNTVSIGIDSTVVGNNTNLADLMIKADKAMYKAKENGRNRVESNH